MPIIIYSEEPEFKPIIINDGVPNRAIVHISEAPKFLYGMCMKKSGRWPEAEPIIKQDACYAYLYAITNYRARWPEAEPYIMKDPWWAYNYAIGVIVDRWPEAEPYIMKEQALWRLYCQHHQGVIYLEKLL